LRFAVGDQVKTYKVDEVRSVTFGDDAVAASGGSAQINRSASPTPTVAADTKSICVSSILSTARRITSGKRSGLRSTGRSMPSMALYSLHKEPTAWSF
jgi:hypothetical protein